MRRIDETWWSTVFGVATLCDLRVAEPLREHRQHLELAIRQTGS